MHVLIHAIDLTDETSVVAVNPELVVVKLAERHGVLTSVHLRTREDALRLGSLFFEAITAFEQIAGDWSSLCQSEPEVVL